MSLKSILIIIAIIIIATIAIIGIVVVWGWNKLNNIDFMLENANKNITPELKTMYGLTDEQCEQVFAGIFILSIVSKEDTKKIMNVDDTKIKKIEAGKIELRTVLISNTKEKIKEVFGSTTISKKIVDLVKTPSDALELKEDQKPIVEKLISNFKTKETLLKKKIEGGKNYNIVETMVAAMPELLSSLVGSD
ncbi:hypothetical protein NGRA_1667 [Nosema granulosis]|uniref:Uncharacterized protein n=1 Tax=Nosema granulosis TaxID=83296 RepID=A0A9P6GY17_9MICR|nr:hypothetical protein NGRA_1667 [Nosema granulosis]